MRSHGILRCSESDHKTTCKFYIKFPVCTSDASTAVQTERYLKLSVVEKMARTRLDGILQQSVRKLFISKCSLNLGEVKTLKFWRPDTKNFKIV